MLALFQLHVYAACKKFSILRCEVNRSFWFGNQFIKRKKRAAEIYLSLLLVGNNGMQRWIYNNNEFIKFKFILTVIFLL